MGLPRRLGETAPFLSKNRFKRPPLCLFCTQRLCSADIFRLEEEFDLLPGRFYIFLSEVGRGVSRVPGGTVTKQCRADCHPPIVLDGHGLSHHRLYPVSDGQDLPLTCVGSFAAITSGRKQRRSTHTANSAPISSPMSTDGSSTRIPSRSVCGKSMSLSVSQRSTISIRCGTIL